MKYSTIIMLLAASLSLSNTYAAENLSEKTGATKDDIKRDAHKSMHKVDEATCTETDTDCAKQKTEHRAEEGKDLIKNKSSEIKNKAD